MYKQSKKWFQDKIGIGENRDRLSFIEKKINFNTLMIQEFLPEILDIKADKRSILALEERAENKSVPTFIHKNDIMFISNLYHNEDMDKALNVYFKLGNSTASMLWAIAEENKKSDLFNEGGAVLDFGAGYGRVSRFLPSYFGSKSSYYASEIKEEAMRFHESSLGYKGIVHGPHAASFKTDQKFDLIFVGSVFTHLPKKMTEDWLTSLSNALNKGGLLIFTTHNIKTYGFSEKGDFYFAPESEDSSFSTIEDSLEDQSEYGTSYISDELIKTWMTERNLNFEIRSQAFGGTQDLIISSSK